MEDMRSKGFREILTKAVCGYGRKTFRFERIISISDGSPPEKLLGSLITQVSPLEISAPEGTGPDASSVPVTGGFHLDVWYSYDSQSGTALAKDTVRFSEMMPITDWVSTPLGNLEAKVELLGGPECTDLSIVGNTHIRALVEFTVEAEVLGDTKMNIEVFGPGN